jgi:hypothetical protein
MNLNGPHIEPTVSLIDLKGDININAAGLR